MKKKNRIWIYLLIVMGFVLILTNSCEKDDLPVLTTSAVTNITQTTATCGGNITSDGGSTITVLGVCWSTDSIPTITDSKTTNGTSVGSFTSNITGLSSNTTYYVRAYATNSEGTGYGSAVSFETLAGTVTDIDGNVYNTVAIGTQVWMKENLKVTKYRNGDAIPNVIDDSQWDDLTTGAYCYYDNSSSNGTTYGGLYNWYAVNDSRKIAPTGWHVSTLTEWMTLITYLGGESVAGGKIKETGTIHWQSPNIGATNESGFTALPGGFRWDEFYSIGSTGYWWSSTESTLSNAWGLVVYNDYSEINHWENGYWCGYSVRCLRD